MQWSRTQRSPYVFHPGQFFLCVSSSSSWFFSYVFRAQAHKIVFWSAFCVEKCAARNRKEQSRVLGILQVTHFITNLIRVQVELWETKQVALIMEVSSKSTIAFLHQKSPYRRRNVVQAPMIDENCKNTSIFLSSVGVSNLIFSETTEFSNSGRRFHMCFLKRQFFFRQSDEFWVGRYPPSPPWRTFFMNLKNVVSNYFSKDIIIRWSFHIIFESCACSHVFVRF